MKKRTLDYAFLLLLLFCCCSCQNKNETNETTYMLKVRDAIDAKDKQFLLSEMTGGLSYIPLETRDDCLLAYIISAHVCEDFIFASDGHSVYQFTITGQFNQQIGKIGKGPGEYSGRVKFAVDEINREVFIFGSSLMNVYDLDDSSFKRSFKVNLDVSEFAVLPNGNIVFFTYETDNETLVFSPVEVYLYGPEGNAKDSITNNLRINNRSNIIGPANIYSRNHELYYNYFFRDTLYRISNEFERFPYAIFGLENVLKREDLLHMGIDGVQFPDFIWLSKTLENEQYFFATINIGLSPGIEQDTRNVIYDKNARHIIATQGIMNNIDGGINFWPKWVNNEILIDFFQAYEILDHYNETKGQTEYSEEFLRLVENLQENDNPVLLLVK